MKAVVVKEAGGPQVLQVVERDMPSLKQGWSLVKVMGAGINHSELFTRQGLSPSVHFPRVLGIELVGLIQETTDPDRLPIGQKVVSLMGGLGRDFDGGYAQFALVPNQQLYPVASDLSWEVLASIPETFYTAYGSMLNLKLEADDKILVRAGASGVGQAFIKLVKARFPHIQLVASVRHLTKAQPLLDLGLTQVIEDRGGVLQTDLVFDKILELVGPATICDSLAHLAEGGIVCSTGQLGGKWYLEDFDPIEALWKNVYLTTFASGNVSEEKIQSLFAYIETYQVPVGPDKIVGLDQVSQAHAWLESKESFGKVVILPHKEEI